MTLKITFQPKLVEFSAEERDSWVAGERSDCIDPYCAGLSKGKGIAGFGEYVVGKHWQDRGYLWVHHDFDIVGANKYGKYESQQVLENALGDRLAQFKKLCRTLRPFAENHHCAVEQPDLLVYKRGSGEIRFAECKRHGTPDKVNPRQALGLYLITAMLRVPVDICVVAERGTCFEPLPLMVFVFDEDGARLED